MYVSGEDVRGNRCLPRGYFSQLIRSLVVPSSDVVELEPVELVFQASNFVAVGLHLLVAAVGVLHDLVNDKLRVATSIEAPNP
jgi:antirestriction protein ArdC